MRIVSLLPAATEILYALGAGDRVVGVTHECDFPAEARSNPALIRTRVDPAADPAEIDRQVRELVARGESLYAVDANQLIDLAPDLIVTQDLCHVCAASPEDLASVLASLPLDRRPRVLAFSPHTIADVCESMRQIGEAAGLASEGRTLAERLSQDAAWFERAASGLADHPSVLCLEWFDPPYVAGHWVPEMVRLAGGTDLFGREGQPSFQVEWRRILDAQPDRIVLMPCGYGLDGTRKTWNSTRLPHGWNDLRAVKSGHVYAVDANAYFSRPGPRLADGLRILAALLRPERVRASASEQSILDSAPLDQ